jgi:hypothetical protein
MNERVLGGNTISEGRVAALPLECEFRGVGGD